MEPKSRGIPFYEEQLMICRTNSFHNNLQWAFLKFWFHKMLAMCPIAQRILTSQEGRFSMELDRFEVTIHGYS